MKVKPQPRAMSHSARLYITFTLSVALASCVGGAHTAHWGQSYLTVAFITLKRDVTLSSQSSFGIACHLYPQSINNHLRLIMTLETIIIEVKLYMVNEATRRDKP